jgi:hypothetical protein
LRTRRFVGCLKARVTPNLTQGESTVTPDGISQADWDPVHELALAVVNAGDDQAARTFKRQLLQYLDDLQTRYGELPSILATRADYVDDFALAERLLVRAYDLAVSRADGRNALYAASSLADLYAVDRPDRAQAMQWLSKARALVQDFGSDSNRRECDRIQQSLDAIE